MSAGQLEHLIWNRFNERKQTDDQFQKKIKLKREIQKMLREQHKYFVKIYLFGSTVNKLGLTGADMDLCVVTNENPNQKESEKLTIKKLHKILEDYLGPQCSSVALKTSDKRKVPIIKIIGCRFMEYTFDIDVNINFVNSYRMSHLFWYYSQIDNRFCAMVVYLKILVDEEVKQEIIPSSTIALLVLHFLQCGIGKPRVLPNLQRDRSDVFGRTIPVQDLIFTLNLKDWWKEEKLKPCNKNFVGHENTSVGKLMLMLCQYYIENPTIDLTKITYPYGTANVAESISRNGYAQLLNLFKGCLDNYSKKQ